jgi:hypothetical protein
VPVYERYCHRMFTDKNATLNGVAFHVSTGVPAIPWAVYAALESVRTQEEHRRFDTIWPFSSTFTF